MRKIKWDPEKLKYSTFIQYLFFNKKQNSYQLKNALILQDKRVHRVPISSNKNKELISMYRKVVIYETTLEVKEKSDYSKA